MAPYDPLANFAEWFLTKTPPIHYVPYDKPVWMIERVVSILLYRQPPFQVQMFVVPPTEGGYVIPEHSHPNVDSFEVYVGGDIRFSLHGRYVSMPADNSPDPVLGCAGLRGKLIRVPIGALHGGVFGAQGGVFLSIQHWQNGVEPRCVAGDYDGVCTNPEQRAHVTTGKPVLLDRCVTAADAATLESGG